MKLRCLQHGLISNISHPATHIILGPNIHFLLQSKTTISPCPVNLQFLHAQAQKLDLYMFSLYCWSLGTSAFRAVHTVCSVETLAVHLVELENVPNFVHCEITSPDRTKKFEM